MRIVVQPRPQGIALIIVMIVIVVLGVLAGGFAYSMKVETRLAQNGSFDTELEWMGRSGVELARYVLSHSVNLPNEPWDALNQKWAGGPKGTNDVLEGVSLEHNELGKGSFSIKITDMERKLNINVASEGVLQQALLVVGVDPALTTTIVDSFLDWRDFDENPHFSGAESEDYIANPNPGFAPYMAKNGPIDDISELFLIRGVTEEMYWGPTGRERAKREFESPNFAPLSLTEATGSVGLIDLFTPISSGTLNINTAAAGALQLIPGVDASLAQAIIQTRSGLDAVEGTEDDVPFRTPGELINVPGMIPQFIQGLQGVLAVRSLTFEVVVEARIGQYKRQYVALLRRNAINPRDVHLLYFHWK
ncbi:MAG: general secretion pathway protein GspK [Verrucomicrobiales bacterium]|nr:general secretion pathway protein GspK [Verrucomicrobiales bacterium]